MMTNPPTIITRPRSTCSTRYRRVGSPSYPGVVDNPPGPTLTFRAAVDPATPPRGTTNAKPISINNMPTAITGQRYALG